MECKCGGVTVDRSVVRKREKVAEYVECKACGRVTFRYGKQRLREIDEIPAIQTKNGLV